MNIGVRRGISLILTLFLTLIAVGGVRAAAVTETERAPKDVPPSHWAYQGVRQLLDKGYLALYQDQTFRGDQPVDRYTLAAVVARILEEVAAGTAATNPEDFKMLQDLSNAYRDELVKVLNENNSLTRRLEELSRQGQVFKEDGTQTNAAVQNLAHEQRELQKEVRMLISDILTVKQQVDRHEAEINRLKAENKRQNFYIIIAFIIGLLA